MSLSATQQRSLKVFPAGSNGEFNLPDQMAVVISRGEGSKLWDTEGREYLDFSMGWGSVLVGSRESCWGLLARCVTYWGG